MPVLDPAENNLILPATGTLGPGPIWSFPMIWREGSFVRQSLGTWQINVTGSPSAVTVNLLASLDGVNFYQYDSSTSVTGQLKAPISTFCPMGFLQISLAALTGGTSPTVAVYMMLGLI